MHILVFCYLVVVGYGIARIVFGYRRIDALFLAPLSFSLVITIVSAAVYVTGAFTPLAINGIAAAPLLVLLAAVTLKKTRGSHLKGQVSPVSASGIRVLPLLLIGISLLLSAASIALLLSARTTETTLGPWDVVDPIFFSLIASNALTLLILSKNEHAPLIGWYAAAGAYIGTASAVTAVIYPLGFGFDPILHRAAETLIAQQGFIDPRTLYYGGHYGLVTTLSAMFSLTSATVDRFIVPVLAAISIPVLAYRSFLFARAQQADRIAATLMIVGLPIAALGSGTPWGYALLLTTVVILTSIQLQCDKNKTTLAFLAAAVLSLLFVHPLAGLPIGFIAAGSVLMAYRAFSFRIAIGCVVAAAASAPIAFIANSLLSRQLPVTIIVPDA
ncbi:hypothetical protein HYV71_00940, partial [Candidatus Uhrbacteria bacterium]|nr:hypothetical protein [Candidatus Uhrbacteria bacterium]